MQKDNITMLSIMYLHKDKIDEICEDIINQYKSGACTMPMFSFLLHPQGNPVVDIASELCEQYKKYKAILDKAGVPSGVLINSSIGHGGSHRERCEFQPYVNFTDGKENYSAVCPYDEGFRKYLCDAVKKIALCHPHTLMLDDDFRLITRLGKGCACPLHMKKFNEITGLNLTREELFEKVQSGDEEGKKLHQVFLQLNQDPLVELAKLIRKSIDEVDENINCSFCCGGYTAEYDLQIAKELAGKDAPITLRINNGNYSNSGTRYFSSVSFRAARQVRKLKPFAEIILAETDTCPRIRYSTTAHALHTNFTCSLLEGCNGAKHWLTSASYDPKAGVAYRKIISKYRGFYEEIIRIVPTLKWRGFNTYISPSLQKTNADEVNTGFSVNFLDMVGLPLAFNSDMDGILLFEGDSLNNFSDKEIEEILSKNVVLASNSAEALIKRGFKKYLGVDVRDRKDKKPNREIVNDVSEWMFAQKQGKELVVENEKTEILTKAVYALNIYQAEYLYPASTKFKNELGGTVYVFSGTPVANHDIDEGYSFLNAMRKRQFIDILKEHGEAQVYYPGDAEVYLKTANMDDGGYFVSFINECADPIENIELIVDKKVEKVYKLNEKGEKVDINFTQEGDKITLDCDSVVLNPVLLLIY